MSGFPSNDMNDENVEGQEDLAITRYTSKKRDRDTGKNGEGMHKKHGPGHLIAEDPAVVAGTSSIPDEQEEPSEKFQPEDAAVPKKRLKTQAGVQSRNPVVEGWWSTFARGHIAVDMDSEMSKWGISIEHSSKSFTNFYKAVTEHGLGQKASVVVDPYTPKFGYARKVQELDIWKPAERLFELVEDDVELVAHTQPDGSIARRWRMLARNTMDTAAEDVELFLLPGLVIEGESCSRCQDPEIFGERGTVCKRKGSGACPQCVKDGDDQYCANELRERQSQFAVMTHEVCQDKAKIIALGQIAIHVMNRAPFNLNLESWKRFEAPKKLGSNRSIIVSREQGFVDSVSLVQWKDTHWEDFDIGSLPKLREDWRTGWLADPWSTAWYGEPLRTTQKGNSVAAFTNLRFPGVFVIDKTQKYAGWLYVLTRLLDHEAVDKAKAPAESYCIFGKTEDANADGNYPVEPRGDKTQRMCAYYLMGKAGTVQELKDAHEDTKTRWLKDKSHVYSGPYKRKQFLNLNTDGRQWTLLIPKHVFEDLQTNIGPPLKDLVSARIDVSTNDHVCMAWILQQSLDSLARGDGLVKALSSAFLAVERIKSGAMTRSEILQSYCVCIDENASAETEHHCMRCKTIRPCSNLFREETEDGELLKCVGCRGRDFRSYRGDRYIYDAQIARSASKTHADETKVHTPLFSVAELVMAAQGYAGGDDYSYICGYTDQEISTKAADWPPKWRSCGVGHPQAASFERPFIRYLHPDGQLVLHDPQHNFTVTQLALNIVKGGSSPSCLPLLKKCLQLRIQAPDSPPRVGYHEDVEHEWKTLERAMDHQAVIETLSHRNNAARLQEGQDLTQVTEYLKMEKSGVWDGKTLRVTAGFFALPGGVGSSKDDKSWDWDVILNDIEQMEGDRTFNPNSLQIPRLGRNKIPWLWRTDLCPSDSDYDEEFLHVIFTRRLRMMDQKCDPKHVTDESPTTLFLEYVAQWLENGGKCHFFGCIMIPFKGHLATFSIGRGVKQLTADGGARFIQPGDRMQTGCKTLLPTNMARDYDKSRRTVIFETWKANRLRFRYPGQEGLIKMLEDIVLQVQDSCRWYDAMGPSLNHYREVPLPVKKDQTEYRAKLSSIAATPINEDEEEAVDDEEEFFSAYRDEVLKTSGGEVPGGEVPGGEVPGGEDSSSSAPLNRQQRYQSLRNYILSQGREDDSELKKLLEELFGLVDEHDSLRWNAVLAKFKEINIAGESSDNDDATKQPDVPSKQSRLEVFRGNMRAMKAASLLTSPMSLGEILKTMNSRLEDADEFDKKEAIDMLSQLDGEGEFEIRVGLAPS
jgi:hypothetical protein